MANVLDFGDWLGNLQSFAYFKKICLFSANSFARIISKTAAFPLYLLFSNPPNLAMI